jgi:NAD(P)-dependent dehydrogenase (short-subunit alcohol dehydrogenase family)
MFRSDITDLSGTRSLMQQIKADHGGIDVLFVNAGIGAFRHLEQVDEAFFDQIMGVNLKGPYFAVQHAVPLMGRGGSIVLTSSMGHCTGIPGNSVYAASKAGLRPWHEPLGQNSSTAPSASTPSAPDRSIRRWPRGEMSEAEIDGLPDDLRAGADGPVRHC